MSDPTHLETTLLRLVAARGVDKSICPTEVARAVTTDAAPDAWRRQLSAVRRAALRLAEAGRIDILRKGKPVPPAEARGVIRLRIRPSCDVETNPGADPTGDHGTDRSDPA